MPPQAFSSLLTVAVGSPRAVLPEFASWKENNADVYPAAEEVNRGRDQSASGPRGRTRSQGLLRIPAKSTKLCRDGGATEGAQKGQGFYGLAQPPRIEWSVTRGPGEVEKGPGYVGSGSGDLGALR